MIYKNKFEVRNESNVNEILKSTIIPQGLNRIHLSDIEGIPVNIVRITLMQNDLGKYLAIEGNTEGKIFTITTSSKVVMNALLLLMSENLLSTTKLIFCRIKSQKNEDRAYWAVVTETLYKELLDKDRVSIPKEQPFSINKEEND